MQEQTGITPAELRTPPAPGFLAYLLDAFAELRTGRGNGFGSPQPISWADMRAWAALMGQQLLPWEVQVLRALDVVWLSAWSAGQPKTPPAGKHAGNT